MAKARKKPTKKPVSKPKSKELARPGDPFVAPDKSVISPEPISRTPAADVNTAIDPATFRPNARRTLKDLPADVSMINGVACVFLYTMVGVGDRQIAEALKISIEQVRQMRGHSAYSECFNMVVGEFINANSDHIQARIAAYSHGALSQVANIAFNGEKENNKLRASKDLLEMGGFAKGDIAKRGGDSLLNELRIVFVENEGNVQVNVGV